MEEPIHTTKHRGLGKTGLYTFMLFVSVLIGIIVTNSKSDYHLNRPIVVLLSVLLGFFLLIFWLISKRMKTYKIFEQKIQVYSFWGKQEDELLFSDIHSWTEEKRSSKNGDFYILTLYSGDHKITINSFNLEKEEYPKLKEMVTGTAREDKRKELENSISQSKSGQIVILIFLLIPVYGLISTWYGGMNKLNSGKFISENVVLTRPPADVYHKNGNSLVLYVTQPDNTNSYDADLNNEDPEKSWDSIRKVDQEMQGFNDSVLYSLENKNIQTDSVSIDSTPKPKDVKEERIEIEDYTYKATNIQEILDSLTTGDEIYINRIYPNYDGKLENFFGQKDAYICGISYNPEEKYLTFSNFINARRKSNTILMYVFGGLFCLISLIYAANAYGIKQSRGKLDAMPGEDIVVS